MRRLPLIRALALCLTLACAAFGGGFAWFVHDARIVRPIPADADGIVVLTGGALRVETGLALLEAGVAPRLLISGVGGGSTENDVIASAAATTMPAIRTGVVGTGVVGTGADRPADPILQPLPVLDRLPPPRRITLGRGARTTAGNAVETASWSRAYGLRSLVVVTAGYHMRRALAEIADVAPDVTLRPFPVHPHAPLRLLGLEYVKLVLVEMGLASHPGERANT